MPRNRVALAPIELVGNNLTQLATLPLRAFPAQSLSNSHIQQLKKGSRVLILASNSHPLISTASYIVQELKSRSCQIFVQRLLDNDNEVYDWPNGVYELTGNPIEIINEQHESSFEMVIDCRIKFDNEESNKTFNSSKRILCKDGAFISLIDDEDINNTSKPTRKSTLKTIKKALLFKFNKNHKNSNVYNKRVLKYSVPISGNEEVCASSGMDVRDRLESIVQKVSDRYYTDIFIENYNDNAFEVENATSAFHTLGFNERSSTIKGTPLSNVAVVKMRY